MDLNIESNNSNTRNKAILYSYLKQLDFIAHLEVHLDKKQTNKCSLKLFKKLKKVKEETQINTIEYINFYKND